MIQHWAYWLPRAAIARIVQAASLSWSFVQRILLAICCFAPEVGYYTLQLPCFATDLGPLRASLPTLSVLGTAKNSGLCFHLAFTVTAVLPQRCGGF